LQFNYTDPLAPVHLISGAAGCNENAGFCINPIVDPAGPWSAFRSSGLSTYGYARMEIHNATHLYYEELQVDIFFSSVKHGTRVLFPNYYTGFEQRRNSGLGLGRTKQSRTLDVMGKAIALHPSTSAFTLSSSDVYLAFVQLTYSFN